MKKFWFKGSGIMPLVVLILFLVSSCVDGYHDDWVWASSVKNATLESPAADNITVSFSADGTTQTISWPLVPGAGGYQVSVYDYDDPTNPVVIGEENEIVDGIKVDRPATEDTRYKVVIRTLGNEKNNNKEAVTATEKLYDNLLPVTASVPDNTNLTDYFNANPIPSSTTELCYELAEGGSYTMTGNILQGRTSVTFRSASKIHRATIAVTDGSFVNGGAGLKFKFINMDYANFTGAATNAVILMDSNFPTAGLTSSSYFVVPTSSPILIQSCKITGLKYYLFFDNSKKYGIGTMVIKDCIIGQNTNTFAAAQIRFGAGMLKDFTMVNSTLYNEQAPSNSSNRFMQISAGNVSSVKPTTETWANGSLSITNCTFYQMGKTAQSFNSNGAMGQTSDKVTIQNNIFVDCYENGRVINRFRRGGTAAVFTGGQNTQFYGGLNSYTGTVSDLTSDVNYITSDPQLTYSGNGEFTMTGTAQVAARTGDPRWLPAQ
ncbi:MAG TPA: DUF4992 family lipoprotein [Bacteroidales bacterium]